MTSTDPRGSKVERVEPSRRLSSQLKQCDTLALAITSLFGHDIWQPVRSGCKCFAFQNVCGIDKGLDPAPEVLEATSIYDISIFGIAEPSTVFDDSITHTIDAKIKKQFGRGFISGEGRKSGYNPGGIMQLIRGRATGRHMASGTDKLGRYSWMTLRGSNTKKLCVVTAYRVVQGKGSTPKYRESTTAHW